MLRLFCSNVNRPFTVGGIAFEKNEMWLNKIEILGSCVDKICHICAIHCGFYAGGLYVVWPLPQAPGPKGPFERG